MKRGLLSIAGSLLAAAVPHSAATPLHWSGGVDGSNANLSSAGNWAENLAPANVPDAELVIATRNGATGSIPALLTGADYAIRSLAFDNSAGRFSPSSGLKIGPSTLSTSTSTRTLSFNAGDAVVLSAANNAQVELWRYATGATQILNLNFTGRAAVFTDATSSIRQSTATFAGSGGIRKTGLGSLLLEAANTHSGGLTVAEGMVVVIAPTALGAYPAGVVADSVVLNGGTLRFDNVSSSPSLNRGFQVGAGTGTIDVLGSSVTLFGSVGNVPGEAGILAKAGATILRLASANTHSGGTRLLAGRIRYSSANSFGTGPLTLGNDTGVVASAADLPVSNSIRLTGSPVRFGGDGFAQIHHGNLDLTGGARTVRLSDPAVFNGVISNGSLELIADSPDFTLTLNGNHTHQGGTTVSSGILNVATGSIGALTVASGANLVIGSTVSVNGAIQCSGTLSHAGQIGQIILAGGKLSSPGGTLTLAAGASISGTGMIIGNLNLAAGSSITGTAGGTLLVTGSITGAGQVTNIVRTIDPSTVVNGVETSPIGVAVFTADFDFPNGFPVTGMPVFRFDLGAPAASDRVDFQNALLRFGTAGLDLSRIEFVTRAGFGGGVYPLITGTQTIVGSLGETIRGTVGGLPAWLRIGNDGKSIELRVGAAADEFPYSSGQTYFGRNDYIEYRAGDVPVLLVAGHDGLVEPDEIPERTYGVITRDTSANALTLAMAAEYTLRTGRRPHVILNHLRRTRLDPNREIVEAAQGNAYAEQAWHEFHDSFLRTARDAMERQFGFALTFDMHGHGHSIDRLEIGYLLDAAELDVSSATMNLPGYAWQSSLRSLLLRNPSLPFPDLIRGPKSLGERFVEHGVPAWPSATFPTIGNAPFFNGGYTTSENSCLDHNNSVAAIQIESHYGVRDSTAHRAEFGRDFADVLQAYLVDYYQFSPGTGSLLGLKSNLAETRRGGSPVTLTVSRQGYLGAAETVALAFSGDAVKGTDYTVSAESVSFSVGQSQKTLTLTPAASGPVQGDRLVAVALAPQYRQSIDGTKAAVTLADGVSQIVRISAAETTVRKEAGAAIFHLQRTLSGGSLQVPLLWSGTAVAGGHYDPVATALFPAGALSVNLEVPLRDDGYLEDDLTLAVAVASSPNYTRGMPSQAVVRLTDDDRPHGLAAWLTDGLAGNVWQDRSGSGLHATTLPGGLGPVAGAVVAGVAGAVTFDGVSATAALREFPVDPGSPFSIAFYFRAEPGSLTTERNLLSYGERGDPGALGIYFSSTTQLRTSLGTGTPIAISGSWNDGTWRHYALTVAANGAVRIYINGLLAASAASWAGPLVANQWCWIGWRPGIQATAAFFKGAIRDFRIYRDVVSPAVAKSLAGGKTTYESWLADFSIAETAAAGSLFQRYAAGLKPWDAAPSVPLFKFSGTQFELEFSRQISAADVRYEVQRATGLAAADWETIATLPPSAPSWVIHRSQISLSDLHGRIIVADDSPASNEEPRLFYRIVSKKD
ncbi:autotransporter-associated beta strand repeat-containing protein [bacterium]|nr:autotransporter-associated beta strand repeat-containing protein [bacterium]